MPDYRRYRIPGGSYFFTVTLLDRRSDLLTRHIDALRAANGERGIWQRRFWEHTIRDEVDYARHLDYVHINPVKHGWSKTVREWPYSTFPHWVEAGVYQSDWAGSGEDDLPAGER